MGLNQKLGLEIKGEGAPDIKYTDSKFWSGLSLPMMSIGYEVRLTPMQVLTFFNAIANDGVKVKPRFVEEIRQHGSVVRSFDRVVLDHSICSSETLEKIRRMLEGVVDHGTAKNLRNSNYKIAGKTGTCQIANEKYGYEKGNYQASFVGYFPADNPRYSCIVVVNSPSRSIYYGNLVAGPIFREITDKIYARDLLMQDRKNEWLAGNGSAPYSKSGKKSELESTLRFLDIPFSSNEHESEWVQTRSAAEGVMLRRKDISNTYIPDVTDMGVKDAVYLLENLGLKVTVDGRGTVRGQEPGPGTRLYPGTKVALKMSITEG